MRRSATLRVEKCFKKYSVGKPSGSGVMLFFSERTIEWISDNEVGWLTSYDSWGEEKLFVISFLYFSLRLWPIISETSSLYCSAKRLSWSSWDIKNFLLYF